jgi:hypothetical protein
MVAASPSVVAARLRNTLDGVRPAGPGVISLDIRKIAMLLWIATAVVLTLGILREVVVHVIGTGTVLKDLRHFDLDSEHSLPAWYESMLMASAAGLLAIIAALARHRDPRNRLQWTVLAVIFILMSIDEIVAVHEVAIVPLRNAFHLSGILYFSWVILAPPVLIALAIFFIPFMLRLPTGTAVRFFVAGALFVGGAFGMELVSGYYASTGGVESLAYKISAVCEECLEIAGMTLFVTTLVQHLAEAAPLLQIALEDRS